jgi:hypothetical protein
MSTNYKLLDKEGRDIRISINVMYIYSSSEKEEEFIHLEKIISIIPKSKYLLIYYHKHENIAAQLPIFADENVILSLAMDILSYCTMRIKMASNNLY